MRATGTRQKIQEAALALFVEKGVDSTTTRDLARSAGIAEGTLYRHYASKDDLVRDLFATNYAAFAHRLRAVRDRHDRFRDRLDAVVAEICAFYDREPLLFRFLLLAQHQVLPKVSNDGDNPVEVLRGMIAEAIAKGDLPPQPAELATAMMLGLVLQPAVALVYGSLQPPFGQYAPPIAEACWRALNP